MDEVKKRERVLSCGTYGFCLLRIYRAASVLLFLSLRSRVSGFCIFCDFSKLSAWMSNDAIFFLYLGSVTVISACLIVVSWTGCRFLSFNSVVAMLMMTNAACSVLLAGPVRMVWCASSSSS